MLWHARVKKSITTFKVSLWAFIYYYTKSHFKFRLTQHFLSFRVPLRNLPNKVLVPIRDRSVLRRVRIGRPRLSRLGKHSLRLWPPEIIEWLLSQRLVHILLRVHLWEPHHRRRDTTARRLRPRLHHLNFVPRQHHFCLKLLDPGVHLTLERIKPSS